MLNSTIDRVEQLSKVQNEMIWLIVFYRVFAKLNIILN